MVSKLKFQLQLKLHPEPEVDLRKEVIKKMKIIPVVIRLTNLWLIELLKVLITKSKVLVVNYLKRLGKKILPPMMKVRPYFWETL